MHLALKNIQQYDERIDNLGDMIEFLKRHQFPKLM